MDHALILLHILKYDADSVAIMPLLLLPENAFGGFHLSIPLYSSAIPLVILVYTRFFSRSCGIYRQYRVQLDASLAVYTANDASLDASLAVYTANDASIDASLAVHTANDASLDASLAVYTANDASLDASLAAQIATQRPLNDRQIDVG